MWTKHAEDGSIDRRKSLKSQMHLTQEAFAAIRAAHGRYQVNRKDVEFVAKNCPMGSAGGTTAWLNVFRRWGWSDANG